MTKLVLTSPLPPSVNSYLNYRINRTRNSRYVQVYPSPDTVSYKRFFIDYVKDQIREQKWKRPEKGKLVNVRMVFYMDRKRKDPSNFIKVPLDALTEAGVYIDDDVALVITDRLYLDAKNPRIEIEIYEDDAIGVFDNEEHIEAFKETNCYQCKKNPDKCGIMKQLFDNRINENVTNGVCLKRKG